jgi:hypothetical protein
MVKSEIVLLTGRKKVDVAVGWKLQPATGIVVGEREREREREKSDVAWVRVRYRQATTETSLINELHAQLLVKCSRGNHNNSN